MDREKRGGDNQRHPEVKEEQGRVREEMRAGN